MRGRKPKPSHLRAVDGNPGKRGTDDATPTPTVVVEMDPPEDLDPIGADLWRQLQPQLARYVSFTVLDVLSLTLLCMSWSRYRQALDALHTTKDGGEIFETTYVTHGRNGRQVKTRPELLQAQAEIGVMRGLMSEMGLTQVSRARLKGLGQLGLPFAGADPLAELNSRYGRGETG